MFSKRHFVLIADILANSHARSNAAWQTIVNEFADRLAETNPRFNRERFLWACHGGRGVRQLAEAAE